MSKLKTKPWNVQDYLKTNEDCALYLEACFEEAPDDAAFLSKAIGDVARAKGMTHVAREAGLAREALYRALSDEGNPEFATVLKVLRSLGLRLHIEAHAA
jgi:probable addiction module antidote protein